MDCCVGINISVHLKLSETNLHFLEDSLKKTKIFNNQFNIIMKHNELWVIKFIQHFLREYLKKLT